MRYCGPRGLLVPYCFLVLYLRSPFLQGMRDVRDFLPPVPKDARRRAVNRAHAEAQKRRKDVEVAKRMRKILVHEELEKRHR